MLSSDPWFVVIVGFLIVTITVFSYKTILSVYNWKHSFYKVLYANYFEYWLRRKKLERLSVSFKLDAVFGSHRIMYQLVSHGESHPYQAYIIIILETGVYLLQVHNENGVITGDLDKKVVVEKIMKDRISRKSLTSLSSKSNQVREKLLGAGIESIESYFLFSDEADLKLKHVDGINDGLQRSDLIKELSNNFFEKKEMVYIDVDEVYFKLKEVVFKQ